MMQNLFQLDTDHKDKTIIKSRFHHLHAQKIRFGISFMTIWPDKEKQATWHNLNYTPKVRIRKKNATKTSQIV